VEIVIGDQSSIEFWKNFKLKYKNFDIIIDDGSHIMSHLILTINELYPILNEGGVYMIEDTHTSYASYHYQGNLFQSNTIIEYCKNMVDLLNVNHIIENDKSKLNAKIDIDLFKHLSCVSYYDSVVVLEKTTLPPFIACFSDKK
jgi:uncharacterized protein YycO